MAKTIRSKQRTRTLARNPHAIESTRKLEQREHDAEIRSATLTHWAERLGNVDHSRTRKGN